MTVLDSSLMEIGRATEAVHLNRVLELYQDLGDMVRVAITLMTLGGRSYFLSRWDEAASFYERSAEAAEAAGDLIGAAYARANLGEVRVNQGRLDEAIAMLSEARRTLEAFSYRYMVAWAGMHLGRALAFAGDIEAGIAMLGEAAKTLVEVDARSDLAEARAHIAEVLLASGSIPEAEIVLAEARAHSEAAEDSPLGILLDRVDLAIQVAAGRPVAPDVPARLADRARELNTMFDLCATLRLAERLGMPEIEDAATLASDLGIVDEIALLNDIASSK
jgi:tetratricopeptide (TPR) repeat protein